MFTTLIEAGELALHRANPDWVLIDCRFDLSRPQWGAEAYAAGHIPGALHADLDRDLSSAVLADTGRHPLPHPETFAATLGRWGIDAHVQVVAYDQGNAMYAARLWWLLRWVGHRAVAVLNGGFAAWQDAGLPVSTTPAKRNARRFTALPGAADVVSSAALLQHLHDGNLRHGTVMLIDARGADRFAGQNETLDPVAGHIPGAHSAPFAGNLDSRGHFLPAPLLRERWLQRLQALPAADVISMCGSGVTACHNLLALEHAGLPGARLYAGSWSEWIRDPSRPTEPPRTAPAA
jgi:thiosulfate/3-mercaptopyruvate sulfurtransferase